MIYHTDQILFFVISCAVLSYTALFDLKHRKIPNFITFSSILVAMVFHTSTNGTGGFIFSLAGMFTGIGLLIIPYMLGGAGAGDAKLMGAVGAAIGAGGVFNAFLYVAATGGFYLLLLLLVKRGEYGTYFMRHVIMLKAFVYTGKFFHVPARAEEIQSSKISYGAIIAIGTITYMALQISGNNPIHL